MFCAYTNFPSLNVNGGMSTITLSFFSMLVKMRYEAFLFFCWNGRTRGSLASGIDVGVLPLYVHVSADEMSQKLPMC